VIIIGPIPCKKLLVSRLERKYFLKNGYWQLEFDEERSLLCTFNVPYGQYHFTTMFLVIEVIVIIIIIINTFYSLLLKK